VDEDPLEGRLIAVTRPPHEADALGGALNSVGADTLIVPLAGIEPIEDTTALAAALAGIERYDWIVFTSANGVRSVRRWIKAANRYRGVRIAAVGPATAAAVARQLETDVSFVPERYAADEIAAGLEPLRGSRILLPQANIADPALADELRRRGAHVDAVTAYRIIEYDHDEATLTELRAADAVVLMSGSAARSLARQGGAGDALVVCIGPKTAEAARAAGLEVGLVAPEATSEGIIHALTSHFGENE
jgi:uroporphyrinogen-III synthase